VTETSLPTTETSALRPGKRATIRDIASLAGVSIATVSRVLNQRPDVSPETREAVLQVVREYGFSMNRGARALSMGRTGLIGMTVPFLHEPYFAFILSGVAEALYEQDMRVVVCPTAHQHDREVTLLDRLMHGTTDAAILLLPEESNDELQALHDSGYSFVVVDPRETLHDGLPCVSAAHSTGAQEAVQHLISLGHRRIGAVTGRRAWVASVERLNGYYAALGQAGLTPDPALVVEADWQVTAGRPAAGTLLDGPDPPTAIFAFNDNIAVGVLQAAAERGLRVPEDLSVIGFDDSEQAAIVTPALTTVRQPLAEMGRMTVSLLLRLLDHQPIEALRIEVGTKLIVRASTGPAPRR